MNAIDETFKVLRGMGRKALIPFLTGGFPDFDIGLELCLELAERGADLLEIGVPFSDPIADGPTIQCSSQEALASGANLKKILQMVRRVKARASIPVVLMSYYNPLLRWGMPGFLKAAREAGLDGLIVPDLPPEEAEEMITASTKVGLHPIFLVTPTSDEKRIRLICRVSRGYIYYVSVTGTTGTRRSLASDLPSGIARIREHTQMPIAVGFGISTPAQARRVSQMADGVIIGSALITHIQKHRGRPDLVKETGEFFSSFQRSLS